MSTAGTLNYKLGGDASELGKAFEKGLRYAGDTVNAIQKAFSVRGIFDGLVGGMKEALGGSNFGELFAKSLRGAMGGEQLQQNFEGLLKGEAAKAATTISALKNFADDAGFAGGEIMEAARNLIASAGASPARAVQDLKMLGEVSRGLNKPIGELATVWGKMFRDGAASSRELMEFGNAGVDIYGALAKTLKLSLPAVEELGQKGQISFGQVEAAMRSLTGAGGTFFGQIDRYKNTLGGLTDNLKDTFGKLPGAFFSGVIASGMDTAKGGLRDVTSILDGWVFSTRQFGQQMGAAMTVAKQLNDEGKLFGDAGLIATGLEAGFGKAADVLVAGTTGAAAGFVAVLKAEIPTVFAGVKQDMTEIATDFGERIAKAMGFDVLKEVKRPEVTGRTAGPSREVLDTLKNNPEFGKELAASLAAVDARTVHHANANGLMSEIFANAAKEGAVKTNFGGDAEKRLHEMVAGKMIEARGGTGAVMDSVMTTMRNALTLGLTNAALSGGGIGAINMPVARPLAAAMSLDKFAASDAMSRIGLMVGHGGAQGEAHLRETAKNTARANEHLGKMQKDIATMARGKHQARF